MAYKNTRNHSRRGAGTDWPYIIGTYLLDSRCFQHQNPQGDLITQFDINIQVILNSDCLQTFRLFYSSKALFFFPTPSKSRYIFSLKKIYLFCKRIARVDTWRGVIQKTHCPFSPLLMSLSDKIHMLCGHHGN